MEHAELPEHRSPIVVDSLSGQPIVSVKCVYTAKRQFHSSPCRRKTIQWPQPWRASTNNEDSTMNSGSEVYQPGTCAVKSGSNTLQHGKPYGAPHERCTQLCRNHAVLCAESATRSPQQSRTPTRSTLSCPNRDTADASTDNRIKAVHRRAPANGGSWTPSCALLHSQRKTTCTNEQHNPIRANACERTRMGPT